MNKENIKVTEKIISRKKSSTYTLEQLSEIKNTMQVVDMYVEDIDTNFNLIGYIGYNIKATTNNETPPYVRSAPDKTIDNMAFSFPNFSVIKCDIDLA